MKKKRSALASWPVKLAIIVLFAGVALFINSCKKRESYTVDNAIQVENAKTWFTTAKYGYVPDWDKALVYQHNTLSYVIVPSNISYTITNNKIISRLVIVDSLGNHSAKLMEFINSEIPINMADMVAISQGKTNIKSPYTGNALVLKASHEFLYGWAFENGNIKHELRLNLKKDISLSPQNKKLMTVQPDPNASVCTDWYWTTWDGNTGQVISEVYLYTTCTGPQYGGGGATGTGEGEVLDSLTDIMKGNCLNQTQLQALSTTLNTYLNGEGNADWECAQKAVYDKFRASGKKIGFCVEPAKVTSGNGQYDPSSGIIYYKVEGAITVNGLFSHEFFHGYQDAFYPGGTAQYNMGTTRTGFPNIEFEQALFQDILNGSGNVTGMGSSASQALKDEYRIWIETITNNNTTYPKQFSDFGGQYYYFLNKFHQNAFGYSDGLVKTDLPPNALLYIFSTSNCK